MAPEFDGFRQVHEVILCMYVRGVHCNLWGGICITLGVLQTLLETLQRPRELSTTRLAQDASDLIRGGAD